MRATPDRAVLKKIKYSQSQPLEGMREGVGASCRPPWSRRAWTLGLSGAASPAWAQEGEREAGGSKVQDRCLQDCVRCPGPRGQV